MGGSIADRLAGPVVPLNICFTESGEVDFAAMCAYAGWLAEQGVPVLLLTYGSSDYAWLSDDDIRRLTADISEVNAGRSLFVTSSSFWPAKVCGEFLRFAEKAGADAVKVQINIWGLSGPAAQRRAVLTRYFDDIQEVASIPLLLWCNSGGGEPLSTDLIAEMASRPQVVGLKNDDHPFSYYYDLCRATQDQDFAVLSGGQMRNFAFGHQIGSAGYLCPIAPFRPDIALRFYRTLLDGRTDDAWGLVSRYEDRWLAGAVEIGWLRAIKTAVHLHGLLPDDRAGGSWQQSTAEEKVRVRELLEDVFGPIQAAVL
jgi:dihydrodipicolinate synthase/N-acetylneuraminate lyase